MSLVFRLLLALLAGLLIFGARLVSRHLGAPLPAATASQHSANGPAGRSRWF